MSRGSRVNRPTVPRPSPTNGKAVDGWANVAPVPTALMRDWIRRRLMESRIAGQLTLDALRDLLASREDRP
jgi:hypothetical protein